MKIEICESLVASWLKHIQHCEIVETNWKPSQNWSNEIPDCLENAFEALKKEFSSELFKQSANLSQVLKQSEIDVLGFNVSLNQVFIIETAFHESGLNYGGPEKTAFNVLKKLTRSALVWYRYFCHDKVSVPRIMFVTPKSHATFARTDINTRLNQAEQILYQETDYPFSFDLITNEDFYSKIYYPLTKIANSISDSNELFLRSYQLSKVVEKHHRETVNQTSYKPPTKNESRANEQIEKVKRRVPGWFQNPDQINSRILITFLELTEEQNTGTVSVLDLKNRCNLDDFSSNFNQMHNYGQNNHGKVFEVENNLVNLWEPVSDFIKKTYREVYSQ